MANPTDTVRISVTRGQNGGQGEAVVTIEMPSEAFAEFQDIAKARGKSLTEVMVEALRLERLFADVTNDKDKSLIFRDGKNFQELVTV